ncbi:hypothetical protein [Cystobacter ferrugineus]|uniref:Uncharacterized protein n=1 Tax=Cystobacter ferrugineus TaxID=83449 RepID=A0A1L9B0Y3_9BACT|nr:hypothetical protein [Cystobacter ferrugineus]OJH35920.1 hypothetical protein BON30_35490 [Cystobacter ferrugineus]
MIGALLFAPPTAAGQSPSPAPPSPEVVSPAPTGAVASAPVTPQLTASDLEAWLDGFLVFAA